MTNSLKIKKAKFIYYLYSSNRRYFDQAYTLHIEEMIKVLLTFKLLTNDLECACWLYNTRYPKDMIMNEFGADMYSTMDATSRSLEYAKFNKKAMILLIADRIAHVNYFLENGCKSSFDAFQMTHNELFYKQLYSNGCCDALWAYLNNLMRANWNSLMCV